MKGYLLKSVLTATTILLCWFTPFVSGEANGEAPNLAFTAEPAMSSFQIGQPVIFRFSLRNGGDRDVSVSPAFIPNYDLHLNVTKESGEEVPWCGVVVKWAFPKGRLVTLRRGRALTVSREISCDEKRGMGYSLSGAGRYTVRATYQIPASPRTPVGKAVPPPLAKGPYQAAPVGRQNSVRPRN